MLGEFLYIAAPSQHLVIIIISIIIILLLLLFDLKYRYFIFF